MLADFSTPAQIFDAYGQLFPKVFNCVLQRLHGIHEFAHLQIASAGSHKRHLPPLISHYYYSTSKRKILLEFDDFPSKFFASSERFQGLETNRGA